jgi:hypothetical protein
MTHDDQFTETLRNAARDYNDPPELSRSDMDAMWSEIERESFAKPFRTPSASREVPRATRTWMTRGLLPMAAALVLGIGIGRFVLPRTQANPSPVAVLQPAKDSVAVPEPYQNATSRYLGQTTALLAALPAEVKAGSTNDQFLRRAHDLLLTTRLLMDSPAAADPRFQALLEDLELVLAQVVRLPSVQNSAELDLIRQALEQRDVLPRLRTAVADISADD